MNKVEIQMNFDLVFYTMVIIKLGTAHAFPTLRSIFIMFEFKIIFTKKRMRKIDAFFFVIN